LSTGETVPTTNCGSCASQQAGVWGKDGQFVLTREWPALQPFAIHDLTLFRSRRNVTCSRLDKIAATKQSAKSLCLSDPRRLVASHHFHEKSEKLQVNTPSTIYLAIPLVQDSIVRSTGVYYASCPPDAVLSKESNIWLPNASHRALIKSSVFNHPFNSRSTGSPLEFVRGLHKLYRVVNLYRAVEFEIQRRCNLVLVCRMYSKKVVY
jgi:hypothetical protein